MGTNLFWSFILGSLIASVSCQDCNVQDLVLTQSEEILVASWTGTDSTYICEYLVLVSNNVDTLDPVIFSTTETSLVIPDTVPCSETTVEVSSADGGISVTASIILETSVTTAPILRDMITSCNSIQMIWDAQAFEENICEVTHFQMFCLSDRHNFTIPQAVTDNTLRTFDVLITVLQPDIYYTCNGFIFVTLAGFSPPSDNIEFWSNLDSVRDLQVVETDTSLSAAWVAPLNSEECGVAYDVTYENEVLGSTTVEVTGLSYDFDIELIPCTDYTITVTPISFTASRGTSVSEVITPSVRVDSVTNLEVSLVDEDIVLSWPEAQVGRCEFSYVVRHVLNGIETVIQTTSNSVTFERVPCSINTFSVQVVSGDVMSETIFIDVELDSSVITTIGQVTNVAFDGSSLSWNAPSSVGLCDIQYIVNVADEFNATEFVVSDTNQVLDLIPCSDNWISITGFFEEIVGTSTIVQISANSAELSAPTHVSTEPGFTTASITLQAQSVTENLCTVEAAVMECSNNNGDSIERSIDVLDNANRVFTVLVDSLEEDTIYTCVARLDNSLAGNEFSFRTVPLTIKDLDISDVGQNSFLVSWSEEYGQQFVNSYILTVESLGPLHSVPSRCDIERGATFQFEIPNTQLNSLFVEGLPNYSYKASLVTSYTLGLERTSTEASDQTLTGVPGLPEILKVNWGSGDSELFNVYVDIDWQVPCDLNGGLQGFGINVTANFAVAGTSQAVTVEDGLSADDSGVDAQFGYSLDEVNPFFTYDVAINVVAAEEGQSEIISLTPPNACVCLAN